VIARVLIATVATGAVVFALAGAGGGGGGGAVPAFRPVSSTICLLRAVMFCTFWPRQMAERSSPVALRS